MPTVAYTQKNRPLELTTPLGDDVLLAVGLSGQEGLSQLFQWHLDLLAEPKQEIAFDELLGQEVTLRLGLVGGQERYFSGLVNRVSQGERDSGFVRYQASVVPQFWLLSKNWQSRIFQHLSVPDILKQVLEGLDVTFKTVGTFAPREFCVQYRESDFHFASRLMEEEGIYYYFQHTADGHRMVVANAMNGHPAIAGTGEVVFEKGSGDDAQADRVFQWGKVQELRSGRYTLWDHCFELPHKHLEADKFIQESVAAGDVTHKLLLAGQNGHLEIYDWPGEYAKRFDGVDRGGGDQADRLEKIFEDNKRTATIRMQQEALPGLVIQGAGFCSQFTCGHKFALQRHPHGDGHYLLTTVGHHATMSGDYRSGGGEFHYHNNFSCIPVELPFRPPRATPRPVVQGTQTAVVVGPADEEIFTDKYGRVKVQFHWDREGQNNADSSCWVRVGTPWAGNQWGAIHIPRIGQEVIVDFLEGDPDRPIIIGSVYNAAMMPPYTLPEKRTQSGIKSCSTLEGDPGENFNELRFEDKKDSEDIYFHAEKDFHRVVENDDDLKVGHDQVIEITNDRTETVKEGNETITIEKGDRTETVSEGNETITIAKGDRAVTVGEGSDTHEIKKDRTVTVEGKDTVTVKGDRKITVEEGKDTLKVAQGDRKVTIDMGKHELTISMGDHKTKIDLGKSETEAMQSIELKVGQSSIKLEQSGVTIKGMQVKIEGQIQAEMKGAMTTVKGDGMLTLKGGITMIN